jgi:hypothetical protein
MEKRQFGFSKGKIQVPGGAYDISISRDGGFTVNGRYMGHPTNLTMIVQGDGMMDGINTVL